MALSLMQFSAVMAAGFSVKSVSSWNLMVGEEVIGGRVMEVCRAHHLTQWTVSEGSFISHCVKSAQPAFTEFTWTIVSLKCSLVRAQLVSTIFMVIGKIKEFGLPSP